MNVIENLNDALDFIEMHIDGEISYRKLAQIACCSEYHFKRMFASLAGMPLGEYIRRRRLSLAALAILGTEEKIIDIALRCGYESPDAFTKAFQQFHGIAPMKLRKEKGSHNTFFPMRFRLSITGGTTMECKIIEKGDFDIIGVCGRIPLIHTGENSRVSEVWGKLSQENLLLLLGFSEIDPKGIISAYTNFDDKATEGAMHDLYVGIATDKSPPERLRSRFSVLTVKASKWAVFRTHGAFPESVQTVWARIFDTWLPTSDYELIPGPEISWYDSYDFGNPDFVSDIWIPVKER